MISDALSQDGDRNDASYPQQGAGGVDGGLGQQLAGQVKVICGLNCRQTHQRGRGHLHLASSPGPQLLHSRTIRLVKVELLAGGSRLHGSTLPAIKCHDRETKGVDQHDGVIEKLSLGRQQATSEDIVDLQTCILIEFDQRQLGAFWKPEWTLTLCRRIMSPI